MLTITNLHKSYGSIKVIQDLSLSIAPGEVYGLLGANGAGKTTAINIICGLLAADSGDVTINHQSVFQSRMNTTKNIIGIAPQENLLYKSLSCAENLNFFAKIYGLNGQTRKKRIEETLKYVNLLDQAHTIVETLSGGMRRRLNLAVALVHKPQLVILDEPTTGLDVEARYEIWQLIEELKHQGTSVLLTTHLLDEAEILCDRIGILQRGKVLAEGSLAELRKLIPAQEIILLQTTEEKQAIARGKQYGFTYRYYGNQLAFWLPEPLELPDIMEKFAGITINSIARQSIKLEYIYLEVTQQ